MSDEAMTNADLHLPLGMVGFPSARHFSLTGGEEGVFEMECLEEPDLGFVMVAPAVYFPDYTPVIDEESVQALGLADAGDALVLLVVTLGDENTPPSANLMAPVVVNKNTRVASQVVLIDQGFPLRAPFLS